MEKTKSLMSRLRTSRELILFFVLIGLCVMFSVLVAGFADVFNIVERSRYWVVPGMLAVPMTLIIATGGIDLSAGSMLGMCGIVLGVLYRDAGWPMALASAAAVLTGILAGAVNGGLSSFLKIPPLIVTLATMALYSGIALALSQARPIGNFPLSFQWLGQGDFFGVEAGSLGEIGFPVPLVALLAVTMVGGLVMRCSWIGRFAECIGENELAAEYAAVDVRRLKWLLYTAAGGVCGLGSIYYTSLYATARPEAGRGMELEAIACVVVGGTRISGGRGTVTGTFLGLLIIGVLRYGLEMAGIPSQRLIIFVGVLLIGTAVLNEWLAGKGGQRQ
ncbi:MAG: ABC transporter permease [Terriglobia bacterium]